MPVSGKVDPGDVTLEAALRRELREETGIEVPVRLVSLEWQVSFRADNGEVWRLHAYGVEVAAGFEPQLSSEHDAYEWVTFDEAVRRLHYPDNREAAARLLDRVGTAGRNA